MKINKKILLKKFALEVVKVLKQYNKIQLKKVENWSENEGKMEQLNFKIDFNFIFVISACFLFNSCTSNKIAENIKKTNTVCNTVNASIEWKYCFTPGTRQNAGKLIYYFHGGGGSEKGWVDPHSYSEEIRRYWDQHKIDSPSVIAISFGEMWVLASRSSKSKSGLYEVMKNEVLPYVEKEIIKVSVKERILIGESMGGFNAGTFSLRNRDLFSKVALLCPAVVIGDEKSTHDVKGYMSETSASLRQAEFLIKNRDDYFLSWEQADIESPLTLIRNLPKGSKIPRFFVSCGNKDEFGFFYGATEFVKSAQQKGFDIIWKPEAGGKHCTADIDALIQFLL